MHTLGRWPWLPDSAVLRACRQHLERLNLLTITAVSKPIRVKTVQQTPACRLQGPALDPVYVSLQVITSLRTNIRFSVA